MVDYPERCRSIKKMVDHQRGGVLEQYGPGEHQQRGGVILAQHGPRCGAHRDFGTFTLIFPDGTSGLEVLLDEDKEIWRPVDLSAADSAVLLFGWCANIRSNGRVPAALHRVSDGFGCPKIQKSGFWFSPFWKIPLRSFSHFLSFLIIFQSEASRRWNI